MLPTLFKTIRPAEEKLGSRVNSSLFFIALDKIRLTIFDMYNNYRPLKGKQKGLISLKKTAPLSGPIWEKKLRPAG
jgi:hypothetical protein